MSAVLSFAEIDGQHVELLPARTVLSLFSAGGGCGCTPSATGTSAGATGTGQGITTGAGGPGKGEASFNEFWTYIEGDGTVTNTDIGGAGGAGGAVS